MTARDGWTTLERRTSDFVERLSEQLSGAAADLEVVRHASMFWIRKRAGETIRRPDRIPAGQAEWYRDFFHAALARGVYLPPSAYEVCFLSLAHDEATLAAAAEALTAAARQMAHS
jgi:glutamate-1-semialdehyde 2,1-aminomutase